MKKKFKQDKGDLECQELGQGSCYMGDGAIEKVKSEQKPDASEVFDEAESMIKGPLEQISKANVSRFF